jgi:hypothetical protein
MQVLLLRRRRARLLAVMCDNDSFDDMVAQRLRAGLLSRRGFGLKIPHNSILF